jgi:predicted lipid-binding transport protein (Tim44 family)
MRIRPGRERSLVGGVVALLVMVVGVVMMLSFGGLSNFMLPFLLIWVLIGLVGAAVSFYNAFSRRGLPLYELDVDRDQDSVFCPHCGRPVGRDDEFCRHCGTPLEP